MNARRNYEIKAVVTALTVVAALAAGFLTASDAEAAPPTKNKSTVTVKRNTKAKPVYVKMSGNRRAAETRAQQLYSQAIARKAADEQAVADARAAAAEETSVAASSIASPQTGVVNPYLAYGQQTTYPIGPFGPAVVGYGPNPAISGFPFGNLSGSGYSGTGVVAPNGGFGYASPIVVGNLGGGPTFNSGFPYGF